MPNGKEDYKQDAYIHAHTNAVAGLDTDTWFTIDHWLTQKEHKWAPRQHYAVTTFRP